MIAAVVRPPVAVAGAILAAFVAYSLLASWISSPRVFVDELVYWDAAVSFSDGEGLTVRGEPFRFAPLFPLFLAPILAVATDLELAYGLSKLLNALAFALTAVPVYLISRRLLSDWLSAGVAALSVAVPSGMYVSVVMTESLAYLAAAWALYAMLLAVEHPTTARQMLALLAILAASATRPQLITLFAAYLAALAFSWLIVPTRYVREPRGLAGLWPTGLALGFAGAVIVLLPAFRGTSPVELLGGYDVLWRSYDVIEVGKWFVYHLANVELYVAVVPLAVAPMVIVSLLARAKAGSETHAAFLAVFLASNALLLLVVAGFNSTEYAFDRIHDRYVFYLVPLWLVVLIYWLADGAPRPFLAALLGGGIATVLPLLLPFSTYAAHDDGTQRFNGVASGLWDRVDDAAAMTPYVSGRGALASITLILVFATLLLPRSRVWILPIVVFAVFAMTAQINWQLAARAADYQAASLPASERRWLDESVPSGSAVTLLFVDGGCAELAVARAALNRSEFFNRVPTRGAHVGLAASGLPSEPLVVSNGGALVDRSGIPFEAGFVVAQPGVRVIGRRMREATAARLVLWRVEGAVRVAGVDSSAQLRDVVCRDER